MARRSIRLTGLESPSARLKLPIATKPVWLAIGPGLALGYRRNRTVGTWVARIAKPTGRYATKNVGTADDFDAANGRSILNFWQAQTQVRVFGKGDDEAPQQQLLTIRQTLDRYGESLRTRGGDPGNATRLRANLSAGMLGKAVALMTVADFRKWRDDLTKKLSPASVNRTCSIFKAALNRAADEDERLTRRAWELGLASLPNANEPRNIILSDAVVGQIVEAAYEIGTAFGLLIEVAAVTGGRVSQLARMEVQDLKDRGETPRLSIPVSAKGRSLKAIPHRTVPIDVELAARLRVAAVDRPATAPLLLKDSGDRWRKSDHARPFARAVEAVGQDPAEVSMYGLRHSAIVRELLAGVPIRVVAVNHDTSIGMIEKTYSRHIGDHADALARGALLKIVRRGTGGNVVPLGKVQRD
jgi:integrase